MLGKPPPPWLCGYPAPASSMRCPCSISPLQSILGTAALATGRYVCGWAGPRSVCEGGSAQQGVAAEGNAKQHHVFLHSSQPIPRTAGRNSAPAKWVRPLISSISCFETSVRPIRFRNPQRQNHAAVLPRLPDRLFQHAVTLLPRHAHAPLLASTHLHAPPYRRGVPGVEIRGAGRLGVVDVAADAVVVVVGPEDGVAGIGAGYIG